MTSDILLLHVYNVLCNNYIESHAVRCEVNVIDFFTM